MSALTHLDLKTLYRKGTDDIAGDFYIPCMSIAVTYDRAVGFFSSTIYSIAWPAIKDFVSRDGRMRVICSPIISNEDAAALEEGYSEKKMMEFSGKVSYLIKDLLEHPDLNKPTKALAAFVSMGALELKVAFISKNSNTTYNQIFHDKVGIFRDELNNSVVFKGSMNETWAGLSADGNLESVDVFPSWIGGRDLERVEENIKFFNSLWSNQYEGVTVKPFPEVARTQLLKIANTEELPNLLDEINKSIKIGGFSTSGKKRRYLTPLPHQKEAIRVWRDAGCRGILEHATGSGKTFTAILAMKEHVENGGVALILVPSRILLNQWEEEIKREIQGAALLLVGSGNTRWRKSDRLRRFTANNSKLGSRIIIATMQTASNDKFLKQIEAGQHLMVVADEVHKTGSPKYSKVFSLNSGPRLGLSATPRRFGDQNGTLKILEYFGPIIEPSFTLQDAINCGRLVEYEYFPHTIVLTSEESIAWNEMTSNISRAIARLKQDEEGRVVLTEKIKIMLINRSRIPKKADAKIQKAVDIFANNYENGQKWLVYCEDTEQLRQVINRIEELRINVNEYHTRMEGDQLETLNWFKIFGGVLVSIGCLDEGVDIPTISHALIMASSQNPRQFIQRRGRVLRHALGKYNAVIHDLLVIPPNINEEPDQIAILKSELARAIEFAKTAQNQYATAKLREMAIESGFDPEKISDIGYEEDFKND